MSLRMVQVLECVFAICTAIGLSVKSVPHWAGWLSCFLFLALDTWRCIRVGEISSGSDYKWYGFTFSRDDSPMLFTCVLVLQVLLTLVCFFIFLCSI